MFASSGGQKKKFAHKIMENKMFDWTLWEKPI